MYRVKALFFFPLVTATLAQDIQGWRFFSREDSNKNNDEIIIKKVGADVGVSVVSDKQTTCQQRYCNVANYPCKERNGYHTIF